MEGGCDTLNIMCQACGNVGFADGSDGFFYCTRCGSQADDIVDTGVADEDFVENSNRGALYHASHRRQAPLASAVKYESLASQSQLWTALTLSPKSPKKEQQQDDAYDPYPSPAADVFGSIGPVTPDDFAPSMGSRVLSREDYYNEVRIRYVMGLQLMVQLQCEALVKECGANPLVGRICGPIWLRFVAATQVFDDSWAEKTITDSETQRQGDVEEPKKLPLKFRAEPQNMHGQRAVMIWYRSLRKRIPLSSSMAISFLACHVAREPILPSDMVQWSVEGKLPYFSAFTEIEKDIGPPSNACPLSSSLMFRPSESVSSQKLESLAASIGQLIGLEFPPVNFCAIASRYLDELSLPEERILAQARLIQEWSMPPDLWLSSSEKRLPTRVGVMSILIVAIRILYNINGFGEWEKSLSEGACSSSPDGNSENSDDFDAKKLLQKLHARYNEIGHTSEYFKDLPTYLQYCKDVVFAGMEPPFEDYEEEKAMEQLWEFYQNNKNFEQADDQDPWFAKYSNGKRPRDCDKCERNPSVENKKLHDESSNDTDQSYESSMEDKNAGPSDRTSAETYRERAIRKLKLDMEENRFVYIPPRVKIKRHDYLHYKRKSDDGVWAYVAHADYYILLRACARVAQVDIRLMHMGVLIFEKRLAWLEKRIDHCLCVKPPEISCEFCSHGTQDNIEDNVDEINLSRLNL
ncbi:TATA box-binding protein-associated factor RNA polymerase I subunit B [Punica granatum]|uniref:Uncharacterized protein n=2 Tax=Punica granatum TaxID=22663 RepID=A0A218XX47_PUNGR|nr:TATA box-binding protein-associated factor RNA polymerase I subunit B [Punica granatum]OWM89400.1 hypothetical protein CDL15_Pgr024148 [Punica granatum]PKI40383.1 hypothetical protein CRG98_039229 [Punica granatum]